MKRALLIVLGMVCCVRAEEQTSPALPVEQTEDVWGNKALPFAQAALKAWYQEKEQPKREALAQQVMEFANRADHPEIAEELLAGKPLAQAEIPIPTNAASLPLTILKEWDLSTSSDGEGADAVIRRIGPQHFELWTPAHGWLFNAGGELLHEARVPRRDGRGREWYGAFLPDGQWITTDLWERDDRIYLFSKEGRLVNSFPIGTIAAWARADMTGKRWVVGIVNMGVQNYGWGLSDHDLSVVPWGWKQRIAHWLQKLHISAPDSSWKFVEKNQSARSFVAPRDLGSRGWFTHMDAESDDRKAFISWHQLAHGQWVGWPDYECSTGNSKHGWKHCIVGKDTQNFGFFPGSLTTWVGGDKYPHRPDADRESFQSWIIDPHGKVIGWLPAERVGDDPDGKRMWFVDMQGRLLKVAPEGVISEVLQPTLAGATGENAPFAHVLFPDLKMGFFYTKPGHLVLARWP